jgi:hypothetical protein
MDFEIVSARIEMMHQFHFRISSGGGGGTNYICLPAKRK